MFFWTSGHFITKITFPEISYVWSKFELDLFFAISLYLLTPKKKKS